MTDATPQDDLASRLADMEMRLEEYWQGEIVKLQDQLSQQRGRYAKLQQRVQTLVASVGQLPTHGPFGLVDVGDEPEDELAVAVQRIKQHVDKAADFQRLVDHVNSNEILRAQWNRFLVSLRITGGDTNDPA